MSRKENIMSKKVGEEQVAETEHVFPAGYIRWNVCFTSGVSAPVKEEPAPVKPVDAAVQTEPEPEISPRTSPEPQENNTICSFFGFNCQKK